MAGLSPADSSRYGTRTTLTDPSMPVLTMYEISKILSSTLDLEQALHSVLNVLSTYLHMRRGAVALVASDDGALTVAAALGLPLEAAQLGQGGYPIAAAREVYRCNVPMVVQAITKDDRFARYWGRADALEDEQVSFLCVPIRSADGALGTLSVERVWDDAGSSISFDDDLRFLGMVSNLIGQTVKLHRMVAADRRTLLADAARLQKRARDTKSAKAEGVRLKQIVGQSPAMEHVLDQVRQVARTRTTVLLRGESGTGKEMVARAIHQLSPRCNNAFVGVNCAALPDTLLESELFGHDKGAFTGANSERKGRFEMADGGTLFLDEIGEISPTFQAKLLRVLQEGEFERLGSSKSRKTDVRIIAATNRNLEEAVASGVFRADLYYRINVVSILLPPLRERQDDIELLARHFLDKFNEDNGDSLSFSSDALKVLRRCRFPGNVRELENCVTRVAAMVQGDLIRPADFACHTSGCLSSVLWQELAHPTQAIGGLNPTTPLPVRAPSGAPSKPIISDPTPTDGDDRHGESLLDSRLPDRERLIAAMERSGWVQAKAARLLGLTPRQVGYALRKHNIAIKRI